MKTVASIVQFFRDSQSPINSALQKKAESAQDGVSSECILQISADSRIIGPFDCFIALKGEKQHGLDYLESVLLKQPGLVVSDKLLSSAQQEMMKECPFLYIENLSERLGAFADWFYDAPSQQVKVIGITGTNGKTSTAFYTAQFLEALGHRTALIGTLGNGLFGDLKATQNTTPDVVSVHRLIAQFKAQGAHFVVMEVSSHALTLQRIENLCFEAVALTQVTRDHLDFHGSVEAYQSAKKQLFTEYTSLHKIINVGDEVAQQLLAYPSNEKALFGLFRYTTKPCVEAELSCINTELTPSGLLLQLRLTLNETTDEEAVKVPLMGAFSVENILCASAIILACLEKSSLSLKKITRLLSQLNSVEGRMQMIQPGLVVSKEMPILKDIMSFSEGVDQHVHTNNRLKEAKIWPTVIVDFAHTPDALEQVLGAIKAHVQAVDNVNNNVNQNADNDANHDVDHDVDNTEAEQGVAQSGKLWVVFGCGGDRDQGKRPLMAKVSERIADTVMVTDDNPRFESPAQITQQIMTGFSVPERVLQVSNRQQAIEKVLSLAKAEDVVLIAGKGHENYQDICGVKQPFKDADIVQNWLNNKVRANTGE
ncbi:MAG: UDP-N-acetylmuramoyl-L-alanyl-D-glutamate--2,6-diaminopimelate ligase [Gammaproteobacteria bacterium]|nr:UDP-N-acetylmuramoyl-L-alanyl-D-glutamate--2,6-diaminopimelate ligase [Gammaproteobacteria bacterium]